MQILECVGSRVSANSTREINHMKNLLNSRIVSWVWRARCKHPRPPIPHEMFIQLSRKSITVPSTMTNY